MKIIITKETIFFDVVIHCEHSVIHFGTGIDVKDSGGRRALAREFINAAEKMLDGLNDELRPGRCELCNNFDTVICCINGCHENNAPNFEGEQLP